MLHLKACLRFHFTEFLKLHKKLMVIASAIEDAPEGILKLDLRMH